MILNLVFHDVRPDTETLKRKIDVSESYFVELITKLKELLSNEKVNFDELHLHFDDGYDSFLTRILPHIKEFPPQDVLLAIYPETIGKKGYITKENLKEISANGYEIASHGYSHVSFAVENKKTLPGGTYQNKPFGRDEVLSEQEIIYQLSESKKTLEDWLNKKINKIVIPFGTVNESVIELTKKYYNTIYTGEKGLDKKNNPIQKRIEVRNFETVEDAIKKILEN